MENIEARLDVEVQGKRIDVVNMQNEQSNQELFPYDNQEELQITLLYLSMVDNNPVFQNDKNRWVQESMKVLDTRERVHRQRYSNHQLEINPNYLPSELDKTFDNSFYIREKNRILDSYGQS